MMYLWGVHACVLGGQEKNKSEMEDKKGVP